VLERGGIAIPFTAEVGLIREIIQRMVGCGAGIEASETPRLDFISFDDERSKGEPVLCLP
jgi:hypothetical protein